MGDMNLTIKEAKTKYCPLTLVNLPGSEGTLCYGDECLAWRWLNYLKYYPPGPVYDNGIPERRGYCGLAGPVEEYTVPNKCAMQDGRGIIDLGKKY
jgi:hypothetical protein